MTLAKTILARQRFVDLLASLGSLGDKVPA